jgi:hypothetical protein
MYTIITKLKTAPENVLQIFVQGDDINIRIITDFNIRQESGERSRYSNWLRAERPRVWSSSTGRIKNFLFSVVSRSVLGPTQSPSQWIPGAFYPGTKRSGREADHSPQTSIEVKKTWIYISITSLGFME